MATSNGPNLGLLVDGNIGESHYNALMARWRALDSLIMGHVKSYTLTTPPVSPNDGDTYIVPSGSTGVWAANTNKITRYSTKQVAWEFFTPKDGWTISLESTSTFLRFNGSNWTDAFAHKADLVAGKVPADQLPSYVDDIVEFANLASFPVTGESGKIYVAIDTGYGYRWSGSTYIKVSQPLDEMPQLEAETGTSTVLRAITALRIRQAITAWWASIKGAITGPVAINANSASDALRINQLGAGNALVVEDSSSPDSTPFVITGAGNVVVGATAPRNIGLSPIFSLEGTGANGTAVLITRNSADTSPNTFRAFKTRGTANGAFDAVSSTDSILHLMAYGADGAEAQQAAGIILGVDGAVSAGIVPGKMVFSTTTSAGVLTEVFRIDSSQVLALTSGKLKLALNAGATKLLQSDASGNAAWGPAVGQADAALPTNSDIRAYYGSKFNPGVLPTFEMDFENARFSLYDAGDSDVYSTSRHFDEFAAWFGTDMQITRASTQTYFDALGRMREAPANTVRCDHDPLTGKKLGPFIGESRTNLCRYSADHTQWTVAEATLDAATWTAPGGTAARIWTASSVASTHRLICTINATTVGTSLVSFGLFVYIPPGSDVQRMYLRGRATSGQAVVIGVTGNGATTEMAFLQSSPFGTYLPAPVTASAVTIQKVTNTGVFRVSVTSALSTDAAALSTGMDISWSAGTAEYVAGTANTRLGVWGWQYEVGGSPSPYIPVPGDAAVVRAATTITVSGAKFSGMFNTAQGTFVLQYNKPIREQQLSSVMSVGDGTSQNRMYFLSGNSSATVFDYFEATTAGVGQGTTGNTATAVGRSAFSYATNNVVVGKGGASYTDSTFAVPVVNKLDLGHRDGAAQINGHLTGVTYYPVALSTTPVVELSK